jgi:hypothetical protein
MFTSNLFNRFQILSILLVLCASSPALAQVKPLKTFNNNSQPDTQIATNQWRRFNLDPYSSIIVPGDSTTIEDEVKGVHNEITYFAGSTTLDTQVAKLCAVYNCDTVLEAVANKLIKEGNLVLEDTKAIHIDSQKYTANGIEFTAKDNTRNVQLAGRIYLVDNRLYILIAGTDNDYFDNETMVFFDSLSLI